jgi:hypothetical protein
MRKLVWVATLMSGLFVLALTLTASASPIEPGQVEVVDGDTIRIGSETFRLVGFDAPETYRAQCPSERELGNRATFRLRQLVAGGGLDLERIACSCRAGTEGTPACNYGRSCGVLKAREPRCRIAADRGRLGPCVCVRPHIVPATGIVVQRRGLEHFERTRRRPAA